MPTLVCHYVATQGCDELHDGDDLRKAPTLSGLMTLSALPYSITSSIDHAGTRSYAK